MYLWLPLVALLAAAPQPPDANRCVACHLTHEATAEESVRVTGWTHSAHARAGVACNACHGGNPHGWTEQAAHVGVLPPSERASSVHFSNVAATCGRCHPGQGAAYARSVHARGTVAILPTTPGCTTCHTSMSARLPTPEELERRCSLCHRGSNSGRDRAAIARQQLQSIEEVHLQFVDVQQRLARVHAPTRQLALALAERRAWDAYNAAVDALHAFDSDATDAKLRQAQADVALFALEVDRR